MSNYNDRSAQHTFDWTRLWSNNCPGIIFVIIALIVTAFLCLWRPQLSDELCGDFAGASGIISAWLWWKAANIQGFSLYNASAAVFSGATACLGTVAAGTTLGFLQYFLFTDGVLLICATVVAAVCPAFRVICFGPSMAEGSGK